MPKHSSHILELAKRGAEHRYQELKAEIALLVKHFPHLGGRREQASVLDQMMGGAAPVSKRKRTMSAAARKAVSARMKKYWAARRKGSAKKA